MDKVIVLGSANAVSDEQHENAHLLLTTDKRKILIDCPGNPVVRLKQAGIPLNSITDLILTHFHPDHVSGLPLLLLDMWLLGRENPLVIYGLEHTISRAQQMMALFDWKKWPGFFAVDFITINEFPQQEVLSDTELRLVTSPVKHLLPTIGLRFELKQSGTVFVYSSDTEPTETMVELAHNADVLIHEANGASVGHSSREQCGEIAAWAGVKNLYLIHYPTDADPQRLIAEAQTTFSGPVFVCKDFMQIDLNR